MSLVSNASLAAAFSAERSMPGYGTSLIEHRDARHSQDLIDFSGVQAI
jgi:hypothetical protein